MDHLGRPSEKLIPSVQLHDHATVDYGSEDDSVDHGFEADLEHYESKDDHATVDYKSEYEIKASKYRVLWSNVIDKVLLRNKMNKVLLQDKTDKGNYSRPSGYHEIAVLLLCWDHVRNDLKSQEEVDALKTVFEDQFGYSATISELSSTAKGGLQVEVNYLIANFVREHDGQHNLLIVYYAGNSKPGKTFGDLKLIGRFNPNDLRDKQQRDLDSLVWNHAEELLRPARADILEIFDACYAGVLGLTGGDDGGNDRLFEFLAAAKANKTTRISGKKSFTSALIFALEKLVQQREGRFTTDELLRTIKDSAPDFPKDQEPVLAERGDPHTRAGRIMLHPIRRDAMRISDSQSVESSRSSFVSSENAEDEKTSTLLSTGPLDKSRVDIDEEKTSTLLSTVSLDKSSVDIDDEKISTLLSTVSLDKSSVDLDNEKAGTLLSTVPPDKSSVDPDLQSVVSDRDEIGSLLSATRAPHALWAENHLASLLAKRDALGSLFDEALSKMGQDRFIRNFRRLLKRCYLDLLPHAKTNLEKATNNLLKSRRSRDRVARLIIDIRNPENDEIREQYFSDVHDNSKRLEDWVASNAGLAPGLPPKTMPPPEDLEGNLSSESDISDAEPNDEDQNVDLPNITQMETFLVGAQAFKNLEVNFHIFLTPATMKPIIRSLLSVSSDRISFSTKDNHSICNRMKILAEHVTEDDWNWWPLQPKMRFLKENETRVLWTCHCDTHLWSELSKPDAERLRSLLQSRGSVIHEKSLCNKRDRSRENGSLITKCIKRAAGAVASQRLWHGTNLPGSSSQRNQPANTGQNNAFTTPQIPSNSQNLITSQGQGNHFSIHMPQIPKPRVIFGVEGRRLTLEVDEIKVLPSHKDHDLIQELKRQHKNLRGWLRYWFSMWQLQHCNFVKFKRTIGDRILFHGEDLPLDPTYDYQPRAPNALCPPITPHEFALALRACGNSCKSLSPFHDCIRPLEGDRWLQKIPKWKAQYGWRQSGPEYGWGLQARHVISFVYVISYHILIFAGTFGFWGWYGIRHPDELQNAAVPLTTVAVLLSLFWSATGILKIFREQG